MSQVSLFQKYRSKDFDDLVGQEVVVRTLKNALDSGNMAHAYLFCGPRGTGKTSTARILAKALNCEHGPTSKPCCECDICRRIAQGACLDVMEIDAASHTQVDKIREYIVEKVNFAPAEARYKVYIIDEVHKLSTASFNALLKTLEEPPEHVVFILATTHPHELLPTILSRCQRHDFQRFTLKQIADRIKYVADAEGFSIDDAAAEALARSADGAMRDALVGLEQAAAYSSGHITADAVNEMLGVSSFESVRAFIAALSESDAAACLNIIDSSVRAGRDLQKFTSELLEEMRLMMLYHAKVTDPEVLELTPESYSTFREDCAKTNLGSILSWINEFSETLRRMKSGGSARLLLETSSVRLAVPEAGMTLQALSSRLDKLEKMLAGGVPVRPASNAGFAAPAPAPSRSSFRSKSSDDYSARTQSAAEIALQKAKELIAAPMEPAPLPEKQKKTAAELGWGKPRPAAGASSETSEPRQANAETSLPSSQAEDASSASTAPPSEAVPLREESKPSADDNAQESAAPKKSARSAALTPQEFWHLFLQKVKEKDIRIHSALAEARLKTIKDSVIYLEIPRKSQVQLNMINDSMASLEEMLVGKRGKKYKISVEQIDVDMSPEEQHKMFTDKIKNMFAAETVERPN
ncbi:MAG: DNA polymerase III subunit gamma/tau [bacterium]|nr:DNA polymerase III subunit gamma/tau [bacterium]